MSADIKLRYKDTKVTLVCSTSYVLANNNWGLPKIATNELEKMGVEVIASDRVDTYDEANASVIYSHILYVLCSTTPLHIPLS